MFYLSVIIPCYNEENRIKQTFDAYFKFLSNDKNYKNKKISIVLVDDGSSDNTLEIIKSFESFSNKQIKVIAISNKKNLGKGAALIKGCKEVKSEIYAFIDADLSFQPQLLNQGIPHLKNHDLIIGERKNDKTNFGYSKIRSLASNVLKKIINSFLPTKKIDTQCGFKLIKNNIKEKILPKIEQYRFSFDMELVLLSQQKDLKIKTLPIKFEHKPGSTVNWKDGIRYLLDLISISERRTSFVNYKFYLKLFLLSASISLFVYGWIIFSGYFFSDDFTWLWYGQKIDNSIYKILTFKMSTFYSPIINAFYSLVYSVFEYNPKPYFIAGIIVHILTTFFFGIFSWQLTKSKLIATIVTFLSAFAGNAYEPIVWIGANMHSFTALFILLCLIFYYQSLITKKSNYLLSYLLLSLFFFLLALGTKEIAIITPALLFITSIYYIYSNNKNYCKIFNKLTIFYYFIITFFTGLYLYQQYIWQKNSIWIASKIWEINIDSLLRIPLIFFDNFVPISFLRLQLTSVTASVLWVFSLLFISFIIYKFKNLKLIWVGTFWILISIAPVVFFKTQFWWEPLASRYNYIARFGAILIIATILQHLIVYNKSRYIINSLIYLIIISISAQIFLVTKTISSEYLYVYNTGESLVKVFEEIKKVRPKEILVKPGHPFPKNTAHIVGAAKIIANINEENIIFLSNNEKVDTLNNQILLYWDHQKKSYELK